MFASATFTVVIIHHKCPRLGARFEALCDAWDGVRGTLFGRVIMVKRNIDFTALVVNSLVNANPA